MKINTKEDIEKVVDLLFHDNRGKTFEKLKPYYEKYKKLLANLNNLSDVEFWKKLLQDISGEYEITQDEREKMINLLMVNFQSFVDELVNLRFEHTFEATEERKIKEDMYEIIEKELKDNLHVVKKNKIKLFLVEKETEELYTYPLTPNRVPTWPIVQLEINKDERVVKFSGGKRQRKKIIQFMEDIVDDEDLFIEEESLNFKKFNITLSSFFGKVMTNSPFIIEEIKLLYPGIFFWVKTKYDMNEFKDYLSFLDDPSDFLNIKKIGLKYIKDKETEIPVNLRLKIRRKKSGEKVERSFSMMMDIPKKRFRKDDIMREIRGELTKLGIELGVEYSVPASYYLKRVILDETYRDVYLKFLIETHAEDKVIKFLVDKKIITYEKDSYDFDENKFLNFIASGLRKIQNEVVELPENKSENIRISNIKKNGTRIEMLFIMSVDKEGIRYNPRYKVILTTKKKGYRKYEKIYFIVIEHINYYKLLENLIEKEQKKSLLYISMLINKILKYNLLLLQRVANNSFENSKLLANSQGINKRTLGNKMEINMNIILRYLFGNYIAIGGKDNPDGYLYLSPENQYLIDVKMYKKMTKSEYLKMKNYLDTFYNENHMGSPPIRRGIFIISSKIMENDKLNFSAKRNVFLENKQYEIGFVTVEFILDLFEIYTRHPHIEKYSSEYINLLKGVFISYVEKSRNCNTVKDLDKLRKEKIMEFKEKIDELITSYQPQRRMEAQ